MRAIVKITVLSLLLAAWAATVSETQAQLFQIYPRTDAWKYNITCQDGTGWETAAFDDSAWSSGNGGFTGGETAVGLVAICSTTTLPAPSTFNAGNGGQGHAMFFRKHFNVASTNGLFLTLSNAIDDGAVIYLNGTRIVSLRGPVTDTCAAFSTAGAIGAGTDALLWEVTTLSPAQLGGIIVPGDNVIAVSVHQVNATSSDMVFAQALMGSLASAPTINYAGSSLTNRTIAQCVGSTTLSVSASGSPLPTYQWFKGASPIANATNATFAINNATIADGGSYHVVVSNTEGTATSTPDTVVTVTPDNTPPTLVYALASGATITLVFSEAIDTNNPPLLDVPGNFSVTDTNTGTPVGIDSATSPNPTTMILHTDGVLNPAHGFIVSLDFVKDLCAGNPMGAATFPVYSFHATPLPLAAAWKYLDNDIDPGATWPNIGFNDSAWPSAPAVFDSKRNAGGPGINCRPGNVMTNYFTDGTFTIPETCILLTSPVTGTNLITSYYRTHFNYTGKTNATILEVRRKFDDGGRIFLNGTEILRDGMAAGAVTHTTFATRGGGDADREDFTFLVSPTTLHSGDNLIAVDVHQVNLTSSDMTMGLELRAHTLEPSSTPVHLTVSYNGANVTVTWAGGGTLQSATTLANPSSSTVWTTIVGATSPYTAAATGPQKFYRVTVP